MKFVNLCILAGKLIALFFVSTYQVFFEREILAHHGKD
jgi:hypothetical protein